MNEKEENLTVDDLVKYEYYYTTESKTKDFWMLFRFKEKLNSQPKYTLCISEDKQFRKNDWCCITSGRITRKATAEEIKWVEACSKADKYIEFDQIPNEEQQFIVGKWYRVDLYADSYFKFEKLVNYGSYNTIHCTDLIWKNEYRTSSKTISNTGAEKSAVLLTDLTEIQQFLPLNHPDKIKEQPKQETVFKKDDYIVQLRMSYDLTQFKKNSCFKQRVDDFYIKPCLDEIGAINNGWVILQFTDKSLWRYATKEEIAEYDRIGKPFDVTTLINKPKRLTLLEQAKLKYPVGTKFKSYCASTGNTLQEYIVEKNRDFNEYISEGGYKCVNNQFGSGVIYTEQFNKWAEIIKEAPKTKDLSTLKDCYIELNSEDEYNQITNWLKSLSYKLWNGFSWSYKRGRNCIDNQLYLSGENEFWITNGLSTKQLTISDLEQYGFKYVKSLEAIKSYPLAPDECFIPEYYKYIAHDSSQNFTEGKIYKCRKPMNLEAEQNFIDDKGLKNGFSGSNYKKFTPSTEAEYLAQENKSKCVMYTGSLITGSADPYMNETIEIGDEVEVTESYYKNDAIVRSRGILVKIDNNSDVKYCIKNDKFPRGNTSWCMNVKLISKKANHQTTTVSNKKPDISSAIQVGNEVTNIVVPKSASVVLKNTENEISIKISQTKTIKI